MPPSSTFPDPSTPFLLQPHCHPCPPPPPPCRVRDRLDPGQLHQHPGHRLLQDPVEAQPHEVHHMDDQLPLLARLHGDLCRARPGGVSQSSKTSCSTPIHSDHIQVSQF